MIEGCDTLLMVGSSFPYSEWLPEPGQARGVQIDIDGRMIGMRYPMEVNLVGDSAETLRALIPLLQRKEDRALARADRGERRRAGGRSSTPRPTRRPNPLNPQLLFHELSKRLPDRAILTSDSGSGTDWWARHLRMRSGMKSGAVGHAGDDVPGRALRAGGEVRLPRPAGDRHDRRRRVADARHQLALIDIARYRDRWSNQQLVVLVLHNDDLNQVTWEQRVMSGDPKLAVSQTLPDFPYARYAELIGLKGIRVDAPERSARPGTRRWPPADPAVIEAITDPEVPPLPPAHHASSRPRSWPTRCPAIRPAARSCARRSRASSTSSSTAEMRAVRPGAREPPERWLWNLRAGRLQKTLAATVACSGLPLGLEMYLEHYKGSFGDIWMWSPIVTSPLVSAAGRGRHALPGGGADRAAGRRGALYAAQRR